VSGTFTSLKWNSSWSSVSLGSGVVMSRMSQMVFVLVSSIGRKGLPNERKCLMARKRRLGIVSMFIDPEGKSMSAAH